MRLVAPLALALAACQEPSPPPALSASVTTSAAPSTVTPKETVVRDGWSRMVERLGDLDGGARASQVKKSLEARARDRKLEDQQLEGAMVTLQTQLIRSCSLDDARASFKGFQAAEALSLSSDRGFLQQLLDTAGADGRAKIWQAGEVDQVLSRPREVMIARAQASLPLWLASGETEDARLDAQRLVLTLNLESEATAIRSRTQLSDFENSVMALDAGAMDAPLMVASAMEKVDQRMLQEQEARFTSLMRACDKIAAQQWMFLVAGGSATSYIGLLGGSNGMGDPNDRRITTANALNANTMMGGSQLQGGNSQLGAQPQGGNGQLGAQPQGGNGQLGAQPQGGNGQLGTQPQSGNGQLGGTQQGGNGQLGGGGGGVPGATGTGFPGVQSGGPGAASSTLPSSGGAGGPPSGGNANPR